MIKPKKLQKGDKVATISLSWGGAGAFPQRYQAGKQQMQDVFGLEVVETKHALESPEWIYKNPKARAEDLMQALEDKSIKAIISNIGGDDSIRLLPYINFDIIKNNPKIFLGFSDSTVAHFCFYKAGVTSFYGTSTLVGFAENNGMHAYQIDDIKQSLFSNTKAGIISPNTNGWTSERLDWENSGNQNISRKLTPSGKWNFFQGEKIVTGELLGGCLDVLETLKDTELWVKPSDWKGKIMFLETSEVTMPPHYFKWILRNYVASGIMHNIAGLIIGRPYDNKYLADYEEAITQVICNEANLKDLPIITQMDFGHTCPTFTIPYGIKAEINPVEETFSIIENALV